MAAGVFSIIHPPTSASFLDRHGWFVIVNNDALVAVDVSAYAALRRTLSYERAAAPTSAGPMAGLRSSGTPGRFPSTVVKVVVKMVKMLKMLTGSSVSTLGDDRLHCLRRGGG